mmetsp:Transcript_17260/g.38909  ORF Transcript_17260/g.38909 Transcript_17260/m.38909 type:complete len:81 (+) Transcript_17260:1238-1480(+)
MDTYWGRYDGKGLSANVISIGVVIFLCREPCRVETMKASFTASRRQPLVPQPASHRLLRQKILVGAVGRTLLPPLMKPLE